MKHWKKALGGILTIGVLGISISNAMAADTAVKEKPAMHHNEMLALMDEKELSTMISTLTSEEQSEILILAQTLQDLLPARNDIPGKEEHSEIQAIYQQIEQIFADNGVSVTLKKDKPFMPGEIKAHQENDLSVPLSDAIEERPAQQNTGQNRPEENMFAAITNEMQQLSEEDQAKITDLLSQLNTLRPEPPTMTEEEKEAMAIKHTEIENAQMALLNALKESGVDFSKPALSK